MLNQPRTVGVVWHRCNFGTLDDVSRRRVFGAGEIAAEPGDLGEDRSRVSVPREDR